MSGMKESFIPMYYRQQLATQWVKSGKNSANDQSNISNQNFQKFLPPVLELSPGT